MGDDSLETMREVVALLRENFFDAHLDYPGFVSVGGWAFGTANPEWGGHEVDGSGVCSGPYVEIGVPSDSPDSRLIADRISRTLGGCDAR